MSRAPTSTGGGASFAFMPRIRLSIDVYFYFHLSITVRPHTSRFFSVWTHALPPPDDSLYSYREGALSFRTPTRPGDQPARPKIRPHSPKFNGWVPRDFMPIYYAGCAEILDFPPASDRPSPNPQGSGSGHTTYWRGVHIPARSRLRALT